MTSANTDGNLHAYPVTTRWFHWINGLAIITLIFLGLMIMYAKTQGIPTDGKILLKQAHTLVGYVFVLNLL